MTSLQHHAKLRGSACRAERIRRQKVVTADARRGIAHQNFRMHLGQPDDGPSNSPYHSLNLGEPFAVQLRVPIGDG